MGFERPAMEEALTNTVVRQNLLTATEISGILVPHPFFQAGPHGGMEFCVPPEVSKSHAGGTVAIARFCDRRENIPYLNSAIA